MFQQCTVKFGQSVLDRSTTYWSFLAKRTISFRDIKVIPLSSHFSRLCCRAALELVLFCWNMSFTVFQVLGVSGTWGKFSCVFSSSLLLSAKKTTWEGNIISHMYGTCRLTILYALLVFEGWKWVLTAKVLKRLSSFKQNSYSFSCWPTS